MEAIVFFATIAPGTVIFLSGDKKRNENAWIARLELENFDNSVEFQKAARSNNYVIKCVPFSSILEKQFGRVAFRKVSLSRDRRRSNDLNRPSLAKINALRH